MQTLTKTRPAPSSTKSKRCLGLMSFSGFGFLAISATSFAIHPMYELSRASRNVASMSARRLADRAVSSAAANGHLDVTEIKVLEKTYKTLGLTKDDLYRNLHELGAQDGRAARRCARGAVARRADPAARKSRPATGITLDKKRIAKIQAETHSREIDLSTESSTKCDYGR